MAAHEVVELTSPDAIILRCSCGWSHQIDRRQNAFARAAKVRAEKTKHRREVAQKEADDRNEAEEEVIWNNSRFGGQA